LLARVIASQLFWSVELDRPCTGSETPTNNYSGVQQEPFDYDHIFEAFNTWRV